MGKRRVHHEPASSAGLRGVRPATATSLLIKGARSPMQSFACLLVVVCLLVPVSPGHCSAPAMKGPPAAVVHSHPAGIDPDPSPFSLLALGAITFYRSFISPTQGPRCGFYPSCSAFGLQAVREHGAGPGGDDDHRPPDALQPSEGTRSRLLPPPQRETLRSRLQKPPDRTMNRPSSTSCCWHSSASPSPPPSPPPGTGSS